MNTNATKSSPREKSKSAELTIRRTIKIHRNPSDVYSFCRDLHNLEPLMPEGTKVETKSKRASHWSVRAPGGKRVEWDAEIVKDEPNHAISWRSTERADVANAGSLRFAPASDRDDTTSLKVEIHYTPPGGWVGSLVGKATRKRAGEEMAAGLRRLKEKIEGEK